MNLDNYEWGNIFHKANEINVAMYGPQALKGEKCKASENELQVWMYEWNMNGKKIKSSTQLEFFSEQDACKHAELNKTLTKNKDKVDLEVKSEYRHWPSETMPMKMVMFEILKVLINEFKVHNCEACQLTPAAGVQKAHMKKGGCLDPEMNFVNESVHQCFGIIEPADLVAVYNTICQFLGISSSGSPLLAKVAVDWISQECMADIITASLVATADECEEIDRVLYHCNSPLLDIVRKVVVDLGVKDEIIKKWFGN